MTAQQAHQIAVNARGVKPFISDRLLGLIEERAKEGGMELLAREFNVIEEGEQLWLAENGYDLVCVPSHIHSTPNLIVAIRWTATR